MGDHHNHTTISSSEPSLYNQPRKATICKNPQQSTKLRLSLRTNNRHLQVPPDHKENNKEAEYIVFIIETSICSTCSSASVLVWFRIHYLSDELPIKKIKPEHEKGASGKNCRKARSLVF